MAEETPESSQHDRNAHPPALAMKIMNPVNRAVARTSLGRLLGPVVLLEFDGRRSGKHYAVPVMTYDYNGATVVFTDARWASNFIGGAPIRLRRRGRSYSGVAEVADSAEAAVALRAVLARLRSPRRVGLVIDEGHTPTDVELSSMRSLVRLHVEPS